MHDFRFRGNRFYCENVDLSRVAGKVGTPVFVYSRKTLLGHYENLKNAFKEVAPLICYSMKANSNLSICRLLLGAGAGLDIVSGGELFRAKKIGADPKKIVYASVGKTEEEIEAAIKAGILFFNAESIPELETINNIAGSLKKKTRVAMRVNPDVEAHTHHYITTAKKQNKFGIDIATAKKIFFTLNKKLKNVDICGIHIHIGSQIIQTNPFIQALKKGLNLIDELRGNGCIVEYLNIGGGLGIIYKDETPQTADTYAQAILPLIKNKNLKLILEPGRFIVGNAGILLARISYIKDTQTKRFVIIDAAMNDLIRPSFYGAYHEIVPVYKRDKKKLKKADVVGPVCESGDFIARDRKLSLSLKPKDILAIMGAGAYGFSMSSNYNSRRRAAEVLIDGSAYHIIRKREEYSDLVKNELVV